jgi:hypothetical protein
LGIGQSPTYIYFLLSSKGKRIPTIENYDYDNGQKTKTFGTTPQSSLKFGYQVGTPAHGKAISQLTIQDRGMKSI